MTRQVQCQVTKLLGKSGNELIKYSTVVVPAVETEDGAAIGWTPPATFDLSLQGRDGDQPELEVDK